MARPTPVLPLVGSMSVPPGLSRPSRSAASIRDTATRSLIEPLGFIASIFATSCGLSPAPRRERRTRGVSPMASMIDSLIPVAVSTSLLTASQGTYFSGAIARLAATVVPSRPPHGPRCHVMVGAHERRHVGLGGVEAVVLGVDDRHEQPAAGRPRRCREVDV